MSKEIGEQKQDMAYKFDPQKYGYEPVSNFPELSPFLAKNSFVKVVAIAEKKNNRSVYWYSACCPVTHDDRWRFIASAYDSKGDYESNASRHQEYLGVISTEQFAKALVLHLMSPCMNKSVSTHGKMRLEQNINDKRLS